MTAANRSFPASLAATCWALDPSQSRVKFSVRQLWGVSTVHGRFHRFEGELQLGAGGGGCAALCIDAASVDTGNRRRDRHLRSPDYFDCVRHPFLRFAGSVAPTPGAGLKLRGGLEAAGRTVPLDLVATLEGGGDQLTLVAGANVDARELDMSWSPVGALRTPVELTVHACLRRAD